jgi:hypothetical protein
MRYGRGRLYVTEDRISHIKQEYCDIGEYDIKRR